ncbi:Late embryogenesis abundant protein At1g64065 [Linum grandiflorum]
MADSDNPFASTGKTNRKRRRRNVCLGATAATIILLIIIALILALTVFKAKRPITTVNSVSIDDLTVALDLIKLRPKLNLTLDLNLAIKNPNKVGLKYSDSSAALNYRGLQVGEVPIPAGRISADSTTPMNLTLTLMADRLLSNSQLYSDVLSGELRLNSYAKITGKVTVFNIKVTSTSTCDFTVFLSNRTVGDQTCNYKTKL